MNPYQPVTGNPACSPEYRVSAYAWAVYRGLPVCLGYLTELGGAAARHGRWLGLERAAVHETTLNGAFTVLLWPPEVWAYAEAQLDVMLVAAGLAREQAGWLRQVR